MSKIITWIRTHILILVLIGVVLAIGIFIISHNFKDKEDKETDKQTKKESQMICSTTYEDGEKVTLEFVYNDSGDNLKKLVFHHEEIDLDEDDEFFCKKYDSLPGISCSFDKTKEPYNYTIEFMMNEFDNKSHKIMNNDETFNYLFTHSMYKTKKFLSDSEDFTGMTCNILDENKGE